VWQKSIKIPTDGLRHTVGPSRLVKLANIFFFLRTSCDRAVYAVICCRRVSVCVRHNSQVGRGVETGETGSATAPPQLLGALEQCSTVSLSMWQTDSDDYLHMEVASIRLFLFVPN